MTNKNAIRAAAKAMACLATTVLPGLSAMAQTAAEPPQVEIVVEAPRTIPREADAPEAGSGTTSILTYRTTVRYADLDLSRPADAARLMVRIDNAARYACRQLDRLYPLDEDTGCFEKASLGAKTRAQALIASFGAQASAAAPGGDRPAP